MVVGCAALGMAPPALGIAGYVIPIVIVTASYALFQAANNTAVMTDVAADRRGVVSGMLNLSRNLGLVTGASFMGAVFAFGSGAPDITLAPPPAVASGLRATFAVGTLLMLLAIAMAIGRSRPPPLNPQTVG
jgi:hypothetical protein